MSVSPSPTVTSFDALPLWLTLDHMVELYGKTPRAIERLVRLGRTREIPPPTLTHPMRWSRQDIERHWRGAHTDKSWRTA
jgi:hypothetical protein